MRNPGRLTLQVVWVWVAIGLVGTTFTRGLFLLAHPDDPHAAGELSALVLIAGLLALSRRRLWPTATAASGAPPAPRSAEPPKAP
ncbi:MAG TPA: hypothetical protein VEU74_11945 [Gemmatimonadales bacterium]|nr:hypothetical protein [Gemmatimonadales bacterium]